jgi:hypothetical protein
MKIIAMLKRTSGISSEEFRQDYSTRHVEFVWSRLPSEVAAGVERYVQNHVRNPDKAKFDCITEIVFSDPESLKRWNQWYLSPSAADVRADEDRIIDKSERVVYLTDEVPTAQPGE